MIVHKNSITQIDNHQSLCELFRTCSYDPNQHRGETGLQSFDTGLLILSLKTTTKKTLSCWVVTKGHKYLNKPAAESCRFKCV